MKKQIILVPGTIARRLIEAKISFDVLMNPDQVAQCLSVSELATIEVLNKHLTRLLHPTASMTFDYGKLVSFSTVKDPIVFDSWLDRLNRSPMSEETRQTLYTSVRTFSEVKYADLINNLKQPSWLWAAIKEPFTVYDTDPLFSVIVVHEGFLTGNILNQVGETRSLMSLTEEFLEFVLRVLYMYHPMHEVSGTDCFGLYLRTLNLKLSAK